MQTERRTSRPVTYVLDTNVYRKIARQDLSLPTRLARMVALSYVTYMELMAQLQSCNPRTFPEIQRALVLARQHGRRKLLHWPTDFVEMTVLGIHRHASYKQDAKKALELAVRVRDVATRNRPVTLDGRKYLLGNFASERTRFQQEWIGSFNRIKMLAQQHSNYPTPRTGAVLTASDAAQLNQFVRSDHWRELYGQAIAGSQSNLGAPAMSPLNIARALDAACNFAGAVFRAVLVDGYRAEQNANDAYDHGQLQYLCGETMTLVTDDRPLRNRVGQSSQAGRIISSGEFLQRALT